MPEKPYKAPEVTSEMKMRYHVDAERRYRTMSEDKLQKEYKQLILKKTPWEWFKERVASFVNMVKIAALSIFIGRQETARRIQFGNREEEFEKLKNEVQRDAKITVLEEKLETLQRMKEDKSKESSDFEKTGNTFRINLDGKELDFPEGWSTKNLADQIRDTMLNKEFGDFTADAEYFLAENLHEITRTEVEPAYYIKYSSLELEDKFNKTINDMLRDGSETTRNLSFHTHCIQITINAHEICSVSINGDSVYRDIDGKQDIGQIAEHIADNLGSKLALDDMYRYDESLKKLEDVIEFSNTDMHTREEVSDFEQTMEYDDYNDELEQ